MVYISWFREILEKKEESLLLTSALHSKHKATHLSNQNTRVRAIKSDVSLSSSLTPTARVSRRLIFTNRGDLGASHYASSDAQAIESTTRCDTLGSRLEILHRLLHGMK